MVKTQVLNRGYLKDDGSVIVDMEQLLGETDKGRNLT